MIDPEGWWGACGAHLRAFQASGWVPTAPTEPPAEKHASGDNEASGVHKAEQRSLGLDKCL